LSLEELVAVEEDVVGEPGAGGGDETGTEVSEGHLQRLDIVASNGLLFLRDRQLLRGGLHLVETEVNEPERANSRDGEGDAVGPLHRVRGVRRSSLSGVEDQEQEDKKDLVEELTPTLHQESRSNLAATVKTVVASRDFARANGVLHTRGGSHGVLATNPDAVEK